MATRTKVDFEFKKEPKIDVWLKNSVISIDEVIDLIKEIKILKNKYGKDNLIQLLYLIDNEEPQNPNITKKKSENKPSKSHKYTEKQKKDIISKVKTDKEFAKEFDVKPATITNYRKEWKKDYRKEWKKEKIKKFLCTYCNKNPIIEGSLCEQCRELKISN